MSKQNKALSAAAAALFGKSLTAASEHFDSPQFDSFRTEAEEAANRIQAQQDGNTQMKADLEAAIARADTAEASLATATASLADAVKKADDLGATNKQLQEWHDNHQQSLKGTRQKEDVNLPDHVASLPETHPNRLAVEAAARREAKK